MVIVKPLEAAEIGVPKIVEVYGVMDPLLKNIARDHARQQGRKRVDRGDKTYGCGDEKQRKQIPKFAVDVAAVKGPLVMIPMKWIEPLMQKSPEDSFPWSKMSVQNEPVKQIFHQSPDGNPRRKKGRRYPWMR